jgi:diguanylate cyclase (GGDEF)-like protein
VGLPGRLTLRDVTERRRLEYELHQRAYVDPLTGLANRTLFQDRVHQAAARAAATGTVAGVLVVNLDDFAAVNDTMGHDTGDDLLVATGHRMIAALRPDGMVARLGADEFGAVTGDRRDPAGIERLADAVLAAFAEPFALRHGVVTVQVSIGIATTVDTAGWPTTPTPATTCSATPTSRWASPRAAARGAGGGTTRRCTPGSWNGCTCARSSTRRWRTATSSSTTSRSST